MPISPLLCTPSPQLGHGDQSWHSVATWTLSMASESFPGWLSLKLLVTNRPASQTRVCQIEQACGFRCSVCAVPKPHTCIRLLPRTTAWALAPFPPPQYDDNSLAFSNSCRLQWAHHVRSMIHRHYLISPSEKGWTVAMTLVDTMAEGKQSVKVMQPQNGRAGVESRSLTWKPSLLPSHSLEVPQDITCSCFSSWKWNKTATLTPTPQPQFPAVPPPPYPQLTTLQKNQIWQLNLPLWKGCGLWSFPLGPQLQWARKAPCDTQTGRAALWQR